MIVVFLICDICEIREKIGTRVRTLCGFRKIGSTFHGGVQSPLFKGVLGVWCVRGRFTLLSQCFHRG
jgi:hypothetical protein